MYIYQQYIITKQTTWKAIVCYIQDTRYKIQDILLRHEAHSYNTIYINLNNKIRCITYNDKNTISTSLKDRDK